jgi:hypothetical protein
MKTAINAAQKGLTMWTKDQAITEADAIISAKNGALKALRIVKEGKNLYILLTLTWRKEELYLSTTRNQKEPRRFRNLDRLIEYIETHYPGLDTMSLILRPDPTPEP